MNKLPTDAKNSTVTQIYQNYQGKIILILLAFCFATLVSIYFSISLGAADMKIGEVITTIFGNGSPEMNIIIWKIRLPRIVAGLLAGAGLGISGCIMQNTLRNPLASPSTLGITAAAEFGANIGIIILGGGSIQSGSSDAVMVINPLMVTISAFLASITATVIIIGLAKIRQFTPGIIILAGVAISSLFAAGTTFIQYFANENHIAAAIFWTFGDLGRVTWSEIAIITAVVVISFIYFNYRAWDYNALSNGDESARSLGVNTERIRLGSMLFASLIIAISVSFMGIISFVGLIAPQIMRRIVGNDHRFLIPGSAIFGSFILILSDTIARMILSPIILPVGVITSFLGAPLFIYILMSQYKN